MMRGKPYRLLRSLAASDLPKDLREDLGGDPDGTAPPGTLEKLAILQARADRAKAALEAGLPAPPVADFTAPGDEAPAAERGMPPEEDGPDDVDEEDPGPAIDEVDIRRIGELKQRWAAMRVSMQERLEVVKALGPDATADDIVKAFAERGQPVAKPKAYQLRAMAFGSQKPDNSNSPWRKEQRAGLARAAAKAKASSNGHTRADPAHAAPPEPKLANVYAEGDQTAIDLLVELLDRIKAVGGLRKTLKLLDSLKECVTCQAS